MEVVQKENRKTTASSTSTAKSAVTGTPKKWAVTQRGDRCSAKTLLYYLSSSYVWSKSCLTLTKSNMLIATWVLDKWCGQNLSLVFLWFQKDADPLGTGSLSLPTAISKLPRQGSDQCTTTPALGKPSGFVAALLVFWWGEPYNLGRAKISGAGAVSNSLRQITCEPLIGLHIFIEIVH